MSGEPMPDGLAISFLRDGGQPAEQTARRLAAFLGAATISLDIAIYDFVLSPGLASSIGSALRDAAARGVRIRLVYEAGHNDPTAGPPPPGTTGAFVDTLSIDARPIASFRALMHHKYVVRDADAPTAAVWTGSTNWTDDAWDREENVILVAASRQLAGLYARNFEALWERQHVVETMPAAGGRVDLQYEGRAVPAIAYFAPGQGRTLAQKAAKLILTATRRLRLASPVVTNGAILGALADAVCHNGLAVDGVYDATQMAQVMRQWNEDPRTAWKTHVWQTIVTHGRLAGKHSTPWGPRTVHDFMHAKILVADDTVLTGSYNLSNNGRTNAENVLLLPDAGLAEICAAYVDAVADHYRR
jgi:phosphatidylserine/phosphatidylglycerophosphate/cardiolipin synthase-like enzyme